MSRAAARLRMRLANIGGHFGLGIDAPFSCIIVNYAATVAKTFRRAIQGGLYDLSGLN
jgi:hypothetical protein